MKWLTLAGILLYLSRHSEAGALKCTPGSQEPSCVSEKREILSAQSSEREKETASAETECLAGSEWESNCHYCRCSDSGIAECLKQSSCDVQVFEEPIKCKPFTTFKRDCSTCTCLMDGLGLCTLIDCPPSERRKREMQCQPGSTWKSDCNICQCQANGTPSCTRKECFSESSSSNLEKRDTSKPNATLVRQTRAAQESAKMCQPGTEFRMDCNKCLCNDEGKDFSCTRIDCAAVNNNGGGDAIRTKRDLTEEISTKCVPGSVFNRDCNACLCTSDGLHAVCALKLCKRDNVDKEPETTPGFRCTPGDQFKRECNDCTCSADGKSVFCTLRLCDQ